MTDLDAATNLLHRSARLLERHRFAHLLGAAGPEPVLRTLRAYRNPDGGFGHALEPDLRGPDSQPVAGQTALEVMHEVGAPDAELIDGACDFLASIARPDGGIPFATEAAMRHPRAPWWEASEASSLTQTAANAAALHALGHRHAWLDGADAFCRARIAALDLANADPGPGLGYDVRFSVTFLNATPDGDYAERALDELAPGLQASGLLTAGGDLPGPLDLAPEPGSRARRLFEPAAIERELDALAAGQQDDGGWTFPWPSWNDAGTHEWRGIVTLDALKVLRANGRL